MDASLTRWKTFRCPSLRLHLSTWLLLLVPAAVLGLANIPGEYRRDWHKREAIGCEHGWPCVWLFRKGLDWSPESVWALTEDVCYFDGIGLAADVLTAIGVLAALAAVIEWRRRRRHRVYQFTLAEWLLAVAFVGWGLAHVADRREKFARVYRAVQAAGGDLYDMELDLPTWLAELSQDSEYIFWPAWWLGWCNIGVGDCELPADEMETSILPPLVDHWPEKIGVTVTARRHSGYRPDLPSIAFDPAALCSLAKLRHLTLERADDQVLACLDSLSELRSLEIDEACGPLSEAAAAHLKGLSKLRFLSATRQCLGDAGIKAVANLTALESLSLAGISDADLAVLGTLKQLRYLTLPDSMVTDAGLARLAANARLEVIEVAGSPITGVGLAPLRRLRELDLGGTGLTDEGLANIGAISSLGELHLRDTAVTGPGLARLGALSRLRRLDLSRTDVDDRGLAFLPPLPALKDLTLDCTRVTHRGLSATYRLPNLKELSLRSTRVANFRDFDLQHLPQLELLEFAGSRAGWEEVAGLRSARPELKFSRGRSCCLYPPGFAWQLEHAREQAAKGVRPIVLAVEGVEVGDRKLASLSGLPRLDLLCLQHTRVTDRGLPVLLEFDELATIDLTGAAISDAGLASLAKLPRLTAIDLSYTDVTAAGVVRLADFPALQVLSLDPSQITEEAVSQLKRIRGLNRLEINVDLGRWGKRYRAARTVEAFIDQLQADLPQLEISTKDHEFWTGRSHADPIMAAEPCS